MFKAIKRSNNYFGYFEAFKPIHVFILYRENQSNNKHQILFINKKELSILNQSNEIVIF